MARKNVYQITADGSRVVQGMISGQGAARTALERIGTALVTDYNFKFTNRRADFFEIEHENGGSKSYYEIVKV